MSYLAFVNLYVHVLIQWKSVKNLYIYKDKLSWQQE